MKVFQKHYKTNFVDDNNVFVGFDDSSCCCENFGWLLTRHVPSSTGEPEIRDRELDGFNFDTSFFEEDSITDGTDDSGGSVTFRLVKGDEEVFLTLYNYHNGYYSHGFEMKNGDAPLHNGCL